MGVIWLSKTTTPLLAILLTTSLVITGGKLTYTFYDDTCPEVFAVVRQVVLDASLSDIRIPASLLRLHFHDCFVHGCDASLLLDNSTSIVSEKDANPNVNSLRGFDVVDKIKVRIEETCPGVVSCADLLAIAAEASVCLNGGPSWNVYVGRMDSLEAYVGLANTALPAPNNTLNEIKAKFADVGLKKIVDLVALSGGHTFGRSNCQNVEARLYNFAGTEGPDPSMDPSYVKKLRRQCPKSRKGEQLVNLDLETPNIFDNHYYSNLVDGAGLLPSDQELFSTPGADTVDLVETFASDEDAFFEEFAKSMVRMGNISPLTGRKGEIRKQCRRVNKDVQSLVEDESGEHELR